MVLSLEPDFTKHWSGVQRNVLSDVGFTVRAESLKYSRNNPGGGVHTPPGSVPEGRAQAAGTHCEGLGGGTKAQRQMYFLVSFKKFLF